MADHVDVGGRLAAWLGQRVAVQGAADDRAGLLADPLHRPGVGDAVEEQGLYVLPADLVGQAGEVGGGGFGLVGPAVDRDHRDAERGGEVLQRVVRGEDAALGGGHGGHFGMRPGVEGAQLLGVGGGVGAIIVGVGGVGANQRVGDVLDVDDAVARVQPGVLVEHGGFGFAADRVLVVGAERLDAAGDDDLGAGEVGLFHQRVEPGLEIVVEAVHEHDAGSGKLGDIRGAGLIEFGVAIGRNDGDEVDMVAGDVGDHVGDDAEGGDGFEPVGGVGDNRQQENGCQDRTEQRVHRSFPLMLAFMTLAVAAVSSETA